MEVNWGSKKFYKLIQEHTAKCQAGLSKDCVLPGLLPWSLIIKNISKTTFKLGSKAGSRNAVHYSKLYSLEIPQALPSMGKWGVNMQVFRIETPNCCLDREKWAETCSEIRQKSSRNLQTKLPSTQQQCRKWLWVIWRWWLPASNSAMTAAKTSLCWVGG